MTTEYPSPEMHVTVLDHIIKASANGVDSVSFVSDEMVINRISIEFRAYFERNAMGHWVGKNIFAYRLEDGVNAHVPATPGQVSKLYAALREACDNMSATFLLDGQDAKLGRDIENLEKDIDRKKLEVGQLIAAQRALKTQYEASALNR